MVSGMEMFSLRFGPFVQIGAFPGPFGLFLMNICWDVVAGLLVHAKPQSQRFEILGWPYKPLAPPDSGAQGQLNICLSH
jgi:hypothetical protein